MPVLQQWIDQGNQPIITINSIFGTKKQDETK